MSRVVTDYISNVYTFKVAGQSGAVHVDLGADAVALKLELSASQTSNMLEIYKSGGSTKLFDITKDGHLELYPYGTSAGNTAEVRFYELAANGTNYGAIKAADSMSASVTWVLPAADGSAGHVLETNGSGALTFRAAPKTLASSRQSATATGAGEVNIYTYSVPANTLGASNAIRYEFRLRRTTGAGNVTAFIKFGGTKIISYAVTAQTPVTLVGTIFGDGATNAQRGHGNLFGSSQLLGATGTSAIDQTSAQNLTLDLDLGTDADVYTLDYACVEQVRP